MTRHMRMICRCGFSGTVHSYILDKNGRLVCPLCKEPMAEFRCSALYQRLSAGIILLNGKYYKPMTDQEIATFIW